MPLRNDWPPEIRVKIDIINHKRIDNKDFDFFLIYAEWELNPQPWRFTQTLCRYATSLYRHECLIDRCSTYPQNTKLETLMLHRGESLAVRNLLNILKLNKLISSLIFTIITHFK